MQLVAELIDGTLIAPGETFSFNGTTGERTAAKGFQEAPVIINGELQNGLGGGICQVSTTVFNAAFEAGLPITARTNHALYISHYPLGRDATVNYPDLDLNFLERHRPTGCCCGRSSAPARSPSTSTAPPCNRRVESTTEPLVETGPVPVKETDDPTLAKGKRVMDEFGSPPRQTSVHRLVYDATGSSSTTTPGVRSTSVSPRSSGSAPRSRRQKPVEAEEAGAGDATTTTPTGSPARRTGPTPRIRRRRPTQP